MRHEIYYILLVFALSLAVASIVYKPMLFIARKYKFYDNPDERKLQRMPVPVMGGFVVFTGAVLGLLCYMFIRDITPVLPVVVAMLVMLLVGAYDDVHNLSPKGRLCIEIVVVVALALINDYGINDFHGLWGIHEMSPWIAWPLTLVTCVGVINAINMSDGIDGLASGLCVIIFGFFSWVAFTSHDFAHAVLGVALVGGIVPFFVMNVFSRKAKMFIGDAGTMMLGIAICEMLMCMFGHDSPMEKRFDENEFCFAAFALAVLAIPVFDTVRVMVGRIARGISPFNPDRTHLHHAFIAYGFHHLEAALLEIILNILVFFVWLIISLSHLPIEWQLYGVVVTGFAVTYGIFRLLRHNTEHK
jgi:UDP-N-acetylmuramyl pentapeptide phosphotransferase/UDP-N-acetylglucosamine-1-phosphate transferase